MFLGERCMSISPDGFGCLKIGGHQHMGSFACKNMYNSPRDSTHPQRGEPNNGYPKEWCMICIEYDCKHMRQYAPKPEEIPQVFTDAFNEEEQK